MEDIPVEIKETTEFGKAVVAKTDLTPGSMGLEVFREEALIVFPPPDRSLAAPWGRQTTSVLEGHCWSDYQYFLRQPEGVQSKVLSFFADMECEYAHRVVDFVKDFIQPMASARNFAQLIMVIKFNSVTIRPVSADGSGQGTYFGHGLFEVACRMAHSCRPNCIWYSCQNGREKIIRAISPIRAGEPLTVNYIPAKLLEMPMFVRRSALRKAKNFDCRCERCTASEGDDARRFRCHNKRCNGYHLVKQVDEDDTPEFVACPVCHKEAPQTFQQSMLDNEEEARRTIADVDHVVDRGVQVDVTSTIRQLKPPFWNHGVALPIHRAQFELYSQLGLRRQAIEAQQRRIDCRLAIHGNDYRDDLTGFEYERLGDILSEDRNWSAAVKAYQNAVCALQISRGGSADPYTRCAMEKLIGVQQKLKTEPAPSHVCSLCGTRASKRCSRCGMAVYCNRDHQLLHWKVHKQICKKS